MKSFFSTLLILYIAVACKKAETFQTGCNCQGPSNFILKDELAVYGNESLHILSKQLDPTYCNPAFLQGKIAENDTIYVSGIIRGSCGSSDIYLPRLEVTDFRKK
ncbi:hypothetical protein IC229_26395 [Spirosoma sp. BT702]|uniref:Lipoprotein n=1 Tax=Spirosoma profusum TaxID=2771354 RepID=A0A927ASP2_9BACT|nr:hypothetical protein [Spirosoma profusum]MBD2704201.1 hypothetical protein [Spirosoma profusum]